MKRLVMLLRNPKTIPSRVHNKIRHYMYKNLVNRGVSLIKLKIQNQPMWINLNDSVLGYQFYVHRDYESFETRLFEHVITPDMVIFDIGANIGFYSVLCATHLTTGTVIAFEPDPTNFEILTKNIELNALQNVKAEQVAVTNRASEIYLYLSETNYGDHRTFDSSDEVVSNQGRRRRKVAVKGLSIDEYVRASGLQPNLIKMDIQGAEIPALAGMESTLKQYMPIIFCEYWPHGLRQSGHQPNEFLEKLFGLDYRIFEIDETNRKVRLVNTKEALTNRLEDETLRSFAPHANLLCIPVHRTDLLNSLSDSEFRTRTVN